MRYTVPLSVRPPSFPMRTILASTSIAVLIASCAVPPALAESLPFAAAPFEDVQETYPYAKAIEYLRLQNIFAEVSTRRIEPDAPLTRGAFVMLMTIPRTHVLPNINTLRRAVHASFFQMSLARTVLHPISASRREET